jgi:hypothetical protein
VVAVACTGMSLSRTRRGCCRAQRAWPCCRAPRVPLLLRTATPLSAAVLARRATEHSFPNFWRQELRDGGVGRVAYVCCAFDDHHVGVGGGGDGGVSSSFAAARGCVVVWAAGVLTRTCPSAARYAWDDTLEHPTAAATSIDGARGAHWCDDREAAARTSKVGWAQRDGACTHLARHAAADAGACAAPPVISFGYDVAWSGAVNVSSVAVLGAGDSAIALLEATGGRCDGVAISRTLAAFHLARSKHLNVTRAPEAHEAVELHPRFLAVRPSESG